MNGEQKGFAMICLPAKQEPGGRSICSEPNPLLISPRKQKVPADFPARTGSVPIDALPLKVLPPQSSSSREVENGGGRVVVAEVEEEKKREKEHKRRSKNWTRTETLKLIKWRSEMEPRFARSGRKSELWDEISEAMRKEGICRDAQQCRDKWEKLTAGYKEVRDGVRDKEDYPFFEELDPLLSGKAQRRERMELQRESLKEQANANEIGVESMFIRSDDEEDTEEAYFPARKRRKSISSSSEMLQSLKELLESLINRQHRFFVELLDSMERKEKIRERIRQEREEKWREEDRAQRCDFHNTMILLTKKLVNDGSRASDFSVGLARNATELEPPSQAIVAGCATGAAVAGIKKRSKNWKRSEVLSLIKLRSEMENRFAKSTRRAALWDELAELLCAEGVTRDGKQCREKWDKLMAEFKDVKDGKRDRGDSPYFTELATARPSNEPSAAVE